MREVGYAVPLDHCIDGEPIDPLAQYRFRVEAGAHRMGSPSQEEHGSPVSGRTLLAMARGDFSDTVVASEAKAMLRHLIRYHLDGKPLNTRRILLDLHQL